MQDTVPSKATGIALKIVSAALFTLMSMLIKLLGTRYPTGELVFFRSFFALLPLGIFLWWLGELRQSFHTTRPMGHAFRGLVGVTGMAFNFAGLALLPLADATAIFYAAPIFAVVLAALFLGERVRVYRWSAVLLGFIGVVITLVPQFDGSGLGADRAMGAMLVLTGALVASVAIIQVRRLTATERTGAIVLWFTLTTTAFGLATLPFGWVWPEPSDWPLLVAIGILGGAAQICLTASYRHADASLIAPFEYTSILFAISIGWAIFGDVPSPMVLLGAAIVIGAGLLVIYRERKLGLERPDKPAAS